MTTAISQDVLEREPGTYTPFMSVKDIYEKDNSGVLFERFFIAFATVLNIPTAVISSKFRKYCQETLQNQIPDMKCSALRAVLEGRIPGIPVPAPMSPAWMKRIQQVLCLMDGMETLAYLYVEDQIRKASPEVRAELKDLRKTLGSVKLPRVMEAAHAVKDKETGKAHGRKVSQSRKGQRRAVTKSGV